MENLNFMAIIEAIINFIKAIFTKEFPDLVGGLFGDEEADA